MSLFTSVQDGEYSLRKLCSASWWAFLFRLSFMNQNWLWWAKVTTYRDRPLRGGAFQNMYRFFNLIQIKIKIILFAWIGMLIETISYLKVGSRSSRLNKKENYLGTCDQVFKQCRSVASVIHTPAMPAASASTNIDSSRKRLYSPFQFCSKSGLCQTFHQVTIYLCT